MAKKIYLLGGGRQNELYPSLDKDVFNDLDKKEILIIDFARDTPEILENKSKRDIEYLKGLGYEKILFASQMDADSIKEYMQEVPIIFVAGGKTEILLDKLRDLGLEAPIKEFKGILQGNSAGAYMCCKEYVKIRDDVRIIPSFGLVDFCCKAHYNEKFDDTLIEQSKSRKIYGICEGAAVVIENNNISFIGDVYLFENGKKTKIN